MLRPALTLAVFVTATVCLAPQLSGARAATQKTDRRADRNSLKSAQIRISSASISTQSDADTIPRLIHQSWKSEAVPRRYERWQQSWKDLHPDWAYKLWTDVSNRALLQDHYIWCAGSSAYAVLFASSCELQSSPQLQGLSCNYTNSVQVSGNV